jgi:hypothetical protein
MKTGAHPAVRSRMFDVSQFRTAHAASWHRSDALTIDCAGAMARVKATLAGSALRGLDPRHALPEVWAFYRSVGEERVVRVLRVGSEVPGRWMFCSGCDHVVILHGRMTTSRQLAVLAIRHTQMPGDVAGGHRMVYRRGADVALEAPGSRILCGSSREDSVR